VTKHWVVVVFVGVILSALAYVLTFLVESLFPGFLPDQYYLFEHQFTSLAFYVGLVLVIVVALLPDFTLKYAKREFNPSYSQILQEMYVYKTKEIELPEWPENEHPNVDKSMDVEGVTLKEKSRSPSKPPTPNSARIQVKPFSDASEPNSKEVKKSDTSKKDSPKGKQKEKTSSKRTSNQRDEVE